MQLTQHLKNQGYQIKKYFTGESVETYNLHFRGEYVSTHNTGKGAHLNAIFQDDERTIKILTK